MKAHILHAVSESQDAQAFLPPLSEMESIQSVQAMPLGEIDLPDSGIILLFMSPGFLEQAESPEGEISMEAAKEWMDGETRHLILFLWKDCDWEEAGWLGMQVVPANEVPFSKTRFWGETNQAFETMQKDLKTLIARNTEITANPHYFEERVEKMRQESGPSPMRIAAKLVWSNIPQKVKWAAGAVLSGLTAWAAYQIF